VELYIKILADYFARHGYLEEMVDATEIVQDQCYLALCKIREILADGSRSDAACFQAIEEIVCALEKIGLDADGRHDFG